MRALSSGSHVLAGLVLTIRSRTHVHHVCQNGRRHTSDRAHTHERNTQRLQENQDAIDWEKHTEKRRT